MLIVRRQTGTGFPRLLIFHGSRFSKITDFPRLLIAHERGADCPPARKVLKDSLPCPFLSFPSSLLQATLEFRVSTTSTFLVPIRPIFSLHPMILFHPMPPLQSISHQSHNTAAPSWHPLPTIPSIALSMAQCRREIPNGCLQFSARPSGLVEHRELAQSTSMYGHLLTLV